MKNKKNTTIDNTQLDKDFWKALDSVLKKMTKSYLDQELHLSVL